MRPVALAIFAWVASDGVHEFTDDQQRIPARYEASATEVYGDLGDYQKLTLVEAEAAETNRRLKCRLEHLRQRSGR